MKLPFEVLFEDNHLLVVNKPAGMLVQGDRTGDEPLIELGKRYLKQKYDKPGNVFLGSAHRIDRPVSGVVVMARTSKALERLNQAFKDRQVEKTYWAIVVRRPAFPEDTLVHWLIKDGRRNITAAYDSKKPGTTRAELSYSILRSVNKEHWLEVKPVTGRPHQIRVQLAKIASPIVGDVKYGAPTLNEDASICLHARAITLMHPVKKEMMTWTAPVPHLDEWNITKAK